MGCSRQWRQDRKLTVSEWAKLCACVERIQRLSGVDLAGPLGIGAPIVTRGRIAFNGVAQTHEDYETFEPMPAPGVAWPFCKTGRRPYDAAVAADRIAPGAFSELTADGGAEDWAEADALCDYGPEVCAALAEYARVSAVRDAVWPEDGIMTDEAERASKAATIASGRLWAAIRAERDGAA